MFMFRHRRPPQGVARKSALGAFSGNPYLFLGPRPFREARLRAYIVGQHRAGRPLSEIVADPYVSRCGSESFCWKVVMDPLTIEALERNVRYAFSDLHP